MRPGQFSMPNLWSPLSWRSFEYMKMLAIERASLALKPLTKLKSLLRYFSYQNVKLFIVGQCQIEARFGKRVGMRSSTRRSIYKESSTRAVSELVDLVVEN